MTDITSVIREEFDNKIAFNETFVDEYTRSGLEKLEEVYRVKKIVRFGMVDIRVEKDRNTLNNDDIRDIFLYPMLELRTAPESRTQVVKSAAEILKIEFRQDPTLTWRFDGLKLSWSYINNNNIKVDRHLPLLTDTSSLTFPTMEIDDNIGRFIDWKFLRSTQKVESLKIELQFTTAMDSERQNNIKDKIRDLWKDPTTQTIFIESPLLETLFINEIIKRAGEDSQHLTSVDIKINMIRTT